MHETTTTFENKGCDFWVSAVFILANTLQRSQFLNLKHILDFLDRNVSHWLLWTLLLKNTGQNIYNTDS